uniref:NADPH--hemoprotein reductase n=1 Tax=Peronospora matthiolae TaxID=2874970 RepID=A0AAV1UG83_9STRA
MLAIRALRRCAYRTVTLHNSPLFTWTHELAGRNQQRNRSFSSDGMQAFLELERELTRKRRQPDPKVVSTGPLTPPDEPDEDECCHLDCPNCVHLIYQEKLLEYELSLQFQERREVPVVPLSVHSLSFYASQDSDEDVRQRLLKESGRSLLEVVANDVISGPYQTADGARRSVRHIDLCMRGEQQEQVGEQASNIGVYVPNDLSVVERMLAHLHVEDPKLVYAAELSVDLAKSSQQQNTLQHQGLQQCPFANIGTVRDALTWTFDLVSTPSSRFLRSLAAYASNDDDIAALITLQVAEAIYAERPHKHVTIADILDRFPSVQLSFADFFQIAPPNYPRFYTVSSSRRLVPDVVSITLGLCETDGLPLPRCSSYLAKLEQGKSVRASFHRSSFVFPFHDHRPIMLISAGTGIAPFRAFLQDLEHEAATSPHGHRPAYLFYGCRNADVDFLYAEELQRARDCGVLDELHVAFSADSDHPKQHVQDALIDQSKLVVRHLLEDEGYIYVCGSQAMSRAVKKAIVAAICMHPEYLDSAIATQVDAERVVAQKIAEHVIVTELW